jgi:hypothetical protein
MFKFSFVLLAACTASVDKGDDVDHMFPDGGGTAAGCPQSVADVGALTGSTAELYANAISVSTFMNQDKTTLGLNFTRIENMREVTAKEYTVSSGNTCFACLKDPAPAECAACAFLASEPHQKLFSARSGTIIVTTAEVEGLGRVAGSFTGLQLAEVEPESGASFVDGGCVLTLGSGTFDADLTLPGGGGPGM